MADLIWQNVIWQNVTWQDVTEPQKVRGTPRPQVAFLCVQTWRSAVSLQDYYSVVLYVNTDTLIHRSQLSCTPAPLVLRIAIIVLQKHSTGLEDKLYGGVLVFCILNSENNSLHKFFTNSLPLLECNWSGDP